VVKEPAHTVRFSTSGWSRLAIARASSLFLRSAREEDISCTARILKPGKRSMYGTAECHGATSGLIAHCVLTYSKVEA
jgi:acyl-coenzyme A thioesterase PaaI-like protein